MINYQFLLRDLLDMQSSLYNMYKSKCDNSMPYLSDVDLTTKEHQQLFRNCAMDMIEELMEAIHHLKNKRHKQADVKEVDFADFREEMIDAFHYFLELLLLAGFDEESLYDEYVKKNRLNFKRIDEGY